MSMAPFWAAQSWRELLGVIDDACTYQPEVSRIIRPDPARAEFYQRKFQRYLECYNKGN